MRGEQYERFYKRTEHKRTFLFSFSHALFRHLSANLFVNQYSSHKSVPQLHSSRCHRFLPGICIHTGVYFPGNDNRLWVLYFPMYRCKGHRHFPSGAMGSAVSDRFSCSDRNHIFCIFRLLPETYECAASALDRYPKISVFLDGGFWFSGIEESAVLHRSGIGRQRIFRISVHGRHRHAYRNHGPFDCRSANGGGGICSRCFAE